MLLVMAKVWHYWLSVALLVPTMLLVLGMGVLYVLRVLAHKYPRQ